MAGDHSFMSNPRIKYYILIYTSFIRLIFSQEIQLQCPDGWQNIGAGCFKYSSLQLSWQEAVTYCNRNGAKLAQVKDFLDIQELAASAMKTSRTVTEFSIGINRLGLNDNTMVVKWNEETATQAIYQYNWDAGQPDLSQKCGIARLSVSSNQWGFFPKPTFLLALIRCETPRPLMCEMSACVKGHFRCSKGGCVAPQWVCDGRNDCGDGSDEAANCTKPKCSYEISGASGSISPVNHPYSNGANCKWTITSPKQSIFIQFHQLDTESVLDAVNVWGGSGVAQKLITKLSGLGTTTKTAQIPVISQTSTITLHSDRTVTKDGFRASWEAVFHCNMWERLKTGVISLEGVTSSQLNASVCADTCLKSSSCVAAVHHSQSGNCHMLPGFEAVRDDENYTYYGKSCPNEVGKKDVARLTNNGGQLTTKSVWSSIASPMYPFYTMGPDLDINWVLMAEFTNAYLTIEVREADILGPRSLIEIRDGKNSNARLISKIDSENTKHTLVFRSTWTSAYIHFKTDLLDFERRGFVIRFKENNLNCSSGRQPKWFSEPGKYVDTKLPNVKPTQTSADLNKCKDLCSADEKCRSVNYNSISKNCEMLFDWREVVTAAQYQDKQNQTYAEIICTPDCKLQVNENTLLTPEMQSFAYQSQVTISCKPGYYFASSFYNKKANITTTCHLEGKWSIPSLTAATPYPTCQPKICGPVPTVTNGFTQISDGAYYGKNATISCDSGFTISGKPEISCNADGAWSTLPTCKANQCSTPRDPDNVRIVQGSGNTTVGTVVSYACEDGYQVKSGSVKIVCDMNGKWSGEPPVCEKLLCGPLIVPQGIPNSSPPYKFGDVIKFACKNGYKIKNHDASNSTCQADQKWSKTPECEDINECLKNKGGCAHKCINIVGSFVCDCNAGYLNSSDFNCEDIDECKTGVSKCDANGKCINKPGSYSCQCNDGYELFTQNGTNGFFIPNDETGLRFGDLYYLNLSCVKKSCASTQAPTNGNILSSRTIFHYEDKVTYSCDIGYQLVGNAERICSASGWSAAEPTCKAMKCSPSLLTSLKYPPIPSITEPVPYKTKVTYSCKTGRPDVVQYERTCLYNLATKTYELIGNNLECPVIDCGVPTNLTGALPYMTGKSTLYNEKFTFKCIGAMKVAGSSGAPNHEVVCKKDGNWDLGSLRCDGESCKDPGTPPGAQQDTTGYEVNSFVAFKCKRNGYALDNDKPLQCKLNDDNSVKFNGTLPSCVDVQPPKITCSSTSVKIDEYGAANLQMPQVSDNTAVKDIAISPTGFVLNQTLNKDTEVTFTAFDYNGLEANCTVKISITKQTLKSAPNITCPESYAEYYSSEPANVKLAYKKATAVADGEVLPVTHSPETVTVNRLGMVHTITATAKNSVGTASCKFQVFTAGKQCNEWFMRAPINGTKSCSKTASGYTCQMKCDANHIFLTAKKAVLDYTCQNDLWKPNSLVPDCTHLKESVTVDEFFWVYNTESATVDETCIGKLQTTIDNFFKDKSSVLSKSCSENFVNSPPVTVILTGILGSPTEFSGKKAAKIRYSIGSSDQKIIDWCKKFKVEPFIGKDSSFDINNNKPLQTVIKLTSDGCPTLSNVETKTIDEVTPCSDNEVSYQDNKLNYCAICPVGTYKSGTSCQLCPADKYQSETGATKCLDCPLGTKTYSLMSRSKEDCKDTCSKYDMVSSSSMPPCNQCPDDHIFSNGECTACRGNSKTFDTDKCIDQCKAGEYSSNGYPPCYKCPKNFFTDVKGSLSCKECAANKVTTELGQSSCVNGKDTLCKSDTCKNQGTCDVPIHDAVCTCPKGFKGRFCDTNVNECESTPCYNGGTCVDDVGKFSCKCKVGFSGDRCEVLPKFCNETSCENGGMCQNLPTGFQCFCKPPYGGTGCKTAANICEKNRCNSKGGTCRVLAGSIRYVCDCKPGFIGNYCENDIDECSSNPCFNGGNCTNLVNKYSCSCPKGFEGSQCETRIDPCSTMKCIGDGKCIDLFTKSSTDCVCKEGYKSVNNNCELTDPCTPNPCKNSAKCKKAAGAGFTCVCPFGYTGSLCQHNIDDCADADCKQGTCIDKLGEYQCKCNDGYEGRHCGLEINDCAPVDPCSSGTVHNGCKDLHLDFKCTCKDGFSGKKCEVNVDDCQSYPCLHGGVCKDGINSFSCQCLSGWSGKQCETPTDMCPSDSSVCPTLSKCYSGFNKSVCVCNSETYSDKCLKHPSVCSVASPCLRGKCSDDASTVKCSNCGTGFTGDYCNLITDEGITVTDSTAVVWAEKQCLPGLKGSDCNENIISCSSKACPTGAQCQSDKYQTYCFCPVGKTGPACKDSVSDFDICFYDRAKSSSAHLYKPFKVGGSEITLYIDMRYFYKNAKGTVLRLYTTSVDKMNNKLFGIENVLTLRDNEVVVSAGGQKEVYKLSSLSLGTWEKIVILLKTDKIDVRSGGSHYVSNKPMPTVKIDYGFITIGGEIDPVTQKTTADTGFQGCVSRIMVWNKILSEPVADVPTVTSGLVHDGNGYVIDGDAAYVKTTRGDKICPRGYTGYPRCDGPDKIPPKFTCPDDIYKIITKDKISESVPISWTFPTSSDNPVIRSSHTSGSKFRFGRHKVVNAALDNENNAALCSFNVYVRVDNCTLPSNPPGGTQQCTASNTENRYTYCTISCSSPKIPCVTTPSFYTCDGSGSWNYENKLAEFRYPSCASKSADLAQKYILTVLLLYPQLKFSNDMDNNLRGRFATINLDWSKGFCTKSDCTDLKITSVEIVGLDTTYIAYEIKISDISLELSKKGEKKQADKIITDEMTNGSFSFQPNRRKRDIIKISGSQLNMEASYVIIKPVCADRFQANGMDCVKCGIGYKFDVSSKSCVRCPIGSYQDSEGSSACIKCPNDKTTQLAGATNQSECTLVTTTTSTVATTPVTTASKLACKAGYFFNKAKSVCEPCGVGEYQPQKAQEKCIPCKPGHSTYGKTGNIECFSICTLGLHNCSVNALCEEVTMSEFKCKCKPSYIGNGYVCRPSNPTQYEAIIGGTIGGISAVIFTLLLAVWICWCKRKSYEKEQEMRDDVINQIGSDAIPNAAYSNPMFDDDKEHDFGNMMPVVYSHMSSSLGQMSPRNSGMYFSHNGTMKSSAVFTAGCVAGQPGRGQMVARSDQQQTALIFDDDFDDEGVETDIPAE